MITMNDIVSITDLLYSLKMCAARIAVYLLSPRIFET